VPGPRSPRRPLRVRELRLPRNDRLRDLDDYGRWDYDATYGHVWVPTRVDAGWAPYREGHWAFVAPWGWTWVDDAPWGSLRSTMDAVSGARDVGLGFRDPYSSVPCTLRLWLLRRRRRIHVSVGFGGGGGVAWFPLGPGESSFPGTT